ncbi:MAG: DUF1330 domain-containing protein [Pseudomonadota bacterium]
MTVYAIAQIAIHDRPRYERYLARFMPVLTQYGGRLLAADEAPTVVAGAWPYHKLILLAFPDQAAFARWEASSEYQDIAKDRVAATEGVILLVRGVA